MWKIPNAEPPVDCMADSADGARVGSSLSSLFTARSRYQKPIEGLLKGYNGFHRHFWYIQEDICRMRFEVVRLDIPKSEWCPSKIILVGL